MATAPANALRALIFADVSYPGAGDTSHEDDACSFGDHPDEVLVDFSLSGSESAAASTPARKTRNPSGDQRSVEIHAESVCASETRSRSPSRSSSPAVSASASPQGRRFPTIASPRAMSSAGSTSRQIISDSKSGFPMQVQLNRSRSASQEGQGSSLQQMAESHKNWLTDRQYSKGQTELSSKSSIHVFSGDASPSQVADSDVTKVKSPLGPIGIQTFKRRPSPLGSHAGRSMYRLPWLGGLAPEVRESLAKCTSPRAARACLRAAVRSSTASQEAAAQDVGIAFGRIVSAEQDRVRQLEEQLASLRERNQDELALLRQHQKDYIRKAKLQMLMQYAPTESERVSSLQVFKAHYQDCNQGISRHGSSHQSSPRSGLRHSANTGAL